LNHKIPRWRNLFPSFNWKSRWRYTGLVVQKVQASLRLQLILIFVVCLLAASLAGAIAQIVVGEMNRTPYIDYAEGMQNIGRQAESLAQWITQQTREGQTEEVLYREWGQRLDVSFDRGVKMLIVDLNGNVLVKSKGATETKIDVHSAIQNAMSLRSHTDPYMVYGRKLDDPNWDGREFVSVYPVETPEGRGYLIASGYPYPTIRYKNSSGSWWLFVGLATFFMLFFRLTRGKIHYIEELASGLLAIAKGDLRHRVTVKSRDELGSLALNINHMAEALETKIEEERRAERIKNELVTNVSHDLRTPLTSVIGYLRLLQDGRYSSAEQRDEYLRIAYGKAEQLKGLVEDLFEYTKLANQGVRLQRRDLCINEFLDQFLEEYVPLAEENDLQLIKEFPEERLYASVDPDQFLRVLENLFSNAVKYSIKPGEIRVGLAGEPDAVHITVANHGEPIPEQDLPRLFERFYRVEQSRSTETGGSGLGLAIVKSIVDLHGGQIWAESDHERIEFHIRLPKQGEL
jgi:signal transduction histidine kinase